MRQENDGFVDLLRNYFLAKQLKLSFSVMIVSSSTICCCFETIATCLLLPRGGQKQIDMFWKEVSKDYFLPKVRFCVGKNFFAYTYGSETFVTQSEAVQALSMTQETNH